jgi:hypothetical protein
MTCGETLCSVLLFAVLGLITSATSSIVVAVHKTPVLMGFGIFLAVHAVFLIVLLFFHKEDSKRRWIYIWSALLSFAGGIPLCFETDHFRALAHPVTLILLYGLTGSAVSLVFALRYHLLGHCLLGKVLDRSGFSPTNQCLVFFALNLFTGFLTGICAAVGEKADDRDSFDVTSITYSIGIWILNALLLAGCGYFLASGTNLVVEEKAAHKLLENQEIESSGTRP